jgi:hypothetical protein
MIQMLISSKLRRSTASSDHERQITALTLPAVVNLGVILVLPSKPRTAPGPVTSIKARPRTAEGDNSAYACPSAAETIMYCLTQRAHPSSVAAALTRTTIWPGMDGRTRCRLRGKMVDDRRRTIPGKIVQEYAGSDIRVYRQAKMAMDRTMPCSLLPENTPYRSMLLFSSALAP